MREFCRFSCPILELLDLVQAVAPLVPGSYHTIDAQECQREELKMLTISVEQWGKWRTEA
jgi:hypothetical protein